MYHRQRMRRAAAAYIKMHGQHGRGPARRRRPLNHGDLRLLILALIQEQPRHGYDLMTEIEQRTGGTYKPSPGVMYPALSVLEDQGFVKAKKVEGKRVFNLTEQGEAELAEHAEILARIEERLESLAHPEAELHPGDIRSASRRLRHTLFKTVTETWPDTSSYEEIVEILNQARADIVKAAEKKAN